MVTIGYHASHEQFSPSELLKLSKLAYQAGYQSISCSDHFRPWNSQQGQSGFAWAWLGAALESVPLPFCTVCAPGQRYHPAIIAQAVATLLEMFPGRFSLCIGSGEAMNEKITGTGWPTKANRNQRLLECAQVMRALWRGETVSHNGLIKVEEAKLYTLPDEMPQLIGAAITPETAKWFGGWADGLITVNQPIEKLRKVVDAFRENGGEAKPLYLKVQLSFAKTEYEARMGAYEQWRTNIFSSSVLADLVYPEQFEALASYVKPDDLDEMIHISADINKHREWISRYSELGFTHLSLHNVNRSQQHFIETFGEQVISSHQSLVR